ncbi:hypothetical protein [Burkholderia sp. Se-20378]|uniref:hypothetical protein n=1 Tax=Burkholderia sp. Se-20378 TaxID=2703899 RepID=UPI0019809C82|nr:hypothetical protein [Burkholderia sp. Se-20378]MBN3771288.1 hypothetical protein [Burkholderia sp. Se-20378]
MERRTIAAAYCSRRANSIASRSSAVNNLHYGTAQALTTSLSAIRQLQQRELDAQRVAVENQAARNSEAEALGLPQRSVMDWLTVELQQIRDVAHADRVFECAIQAATVPSMLPFRDQVTGLKPLSGLELCVTRPQLTFDKTEALQFLLCQVWRPTVVMGDSRNVRPMV